MGEIGSRGASSNVVDRTCQDPNVVDRNCQTPHVVDRTCQAPSVVDRTCQAPAGGGASGASSQREGGRRPAGRAARLRNQRPARHAAVSSPSLLLSSLELSDTRVYEP